jgi:hypothetical protein
VLVLCLCRPLDLFGTNCNKCTLTRCCGNTTAPTMLMWHMGDGTWVMAPYKIADCTRYIPYPISH